MTLSPESRWMSKILLAVIAILVIVWTLILFFGCARQRFMPASDEHFIFGLRPTVYEILCDSTYQFSLKSPKGSLHFWLADSCEWVTVQPDWRGQ